MFPIFIGLLAAATALDQKDFSLLDHFEAYKLRRTPPIVTNDHPAAAFPMKKDDSLSLLQALDTTELHTPPHHTDVYINTWAERNQATVITAAVAVPLTLLGMAGVSAYLHKQRRIDEDSESLDSAFGMRRGIDDEDESSVGGLTEDGFQSKFEVGNDAAMWAKQADFSAF